MAHVVMVVDDDTDICGLLSEILTDEGYTVMCVTTGENVLALVQRQMPSVLLLDFHLSGGINGLSVAEQLRATSATTDLPIIMTSADSHFLQTQLERLQVLGCTILAKPFEIDELLSRVERALDSPSLERTA